MPLSRPGTRRTRALLLASALGGVAAIATPAAAQTVTTISTNTTDTTIRSITGTDSIVVNPNVTLTVNGQTRAISWTATTASTPTTGPTIDNSGTIKAGATGARVVDTVGTTASRTITIYNRAGALMQSDEDAIRIYNAGTNTTAASAITIDNAGQLLSAVGDGIDLSSISQATLQLTNTGRIDAGATGVTFGNGTIEQKGQITSAGVAINSTSTITTLVRNIYLRAGSVTKSTGGDGISIAGNSSTNQILIESGATLSGAVNGITFTSGSIDNYGSITGGTNAIVVPSASNSTTVHNITLRSGSTTASTAADPDAIYFNAGLNTVIIETGATITGNIRGASSANGTDTLRAVSGGSGVGILPSISNFENVQIVSGDWSADRTFIINGTGNATVSSGAILRLGTGGNLGSIQGPIINNGALIFNRSDTYTQATAQNISGSGTLEITHGTYAFTNANTYSGATTISGGALTANAANTLSASSAVSVGASGTLNINGSSQTIAGLSGAGTVQLGNNSATVLTFGANNGDAVFSGAITGTGSLVKTGTGTLTLSGTSDFTGDTTISGGNLKVDGSLAGTVAMTTGTLGGSGSIGGAVTMASGTTIAPGGAGVAGTLTTGSLVLNSGTTLAFDLGAPGTANAALSDHLVVNGNLTLAGTLNVNNVGGFGQGVYRLISYTGALTNNGLALGTTPAGTDTSLVTIQTSIGQQVNLVYGDANTLVPAIQFWDGNGSAGDAVITGGAGSWTTTGTNWTRSNGVVNDPWGEQFAVFQNAGGTVTVDGAIRFGGMQFMNNGYTIAAGAGTLTATEVVTSMRVDPGVTATISAGIGGTGGLTKLDSGTLILSGANTYSGGTTVNGGTLRASGAGSLQGDVTIGSGATLDVAAAQTIGALSGAGSVTLNAGLTLGAGDADGSFSGVLSGANGLTKTGTGTLTLSGANTYTGNTALSGGTIRLASGGSLAGGVTTVSGTTLSLAGATSAIGTLSGSAGTVSLGTNGQLTVNETSNTSFSGIISGSGGKLIKQGTATLTLGGSNTFTGGTAINAGTLALTSSTSLSNSGTVTIDTAGTLTLGSNKTIGGLAGSGSVQLGANTLTVNATDTSFANNFSGVLSGTGGLIKSGNNTNPTTLTLGGINTYTGGTAVNFGTLLVNGSIAGDASVATGATLGGAGAVAGTVTLAQGATLNAGPIGGAGVLTVGNLVMNGGASLNYDLGAANVLTANDRLQVTGNVTLAGALNIASTGQFGTGVYRLIDYGGTLTNNGITFGTLPSGTAPAQLDLQTNVANQVNLVVSGQLPDIQFWDGNGPATDGVIQGGAGSWNNQTSNWTDSSGQGINRWGAKFAVFQGAGGTVTVDGAIGYTGLQFMNNGYVLAAGTGALQTTTAEGNVRVDPGVTARIDASIQGTGGLTKLDSGTLILGGANSYTGGTNVNGGTLRAAAANVLQGDVTVATGATLDVTVAQAIGRLAGQGGVVLNADLSVGTGNVSSSFTGVISGSGALTKTGTGTFSISGQQTYTGGTKLTTGTLALTGVTTLGTGAVTISAGSTLNLAGNALTVGDLAGSGSVILGSGTLTVAEAANGTGSYSGVISGTGSLVKEGAGSFTLTGANTFTGGATVNGGTLVLGGSGALVSASAVTIGSGGTLSLVTDKTLASLSGQGNVTFGANTLTLSSGSYGGGIAGTGSLTKTGTGTLTLTGSNTFTGTTTVSGGTLVLSGTGSIASALNISAATGVVDITAAGDQSLAGLRGVTGAKLLLGSNTLTVTDSTTETWSGVISGAGNLVKAGTGTLVFANANTYTGTTTVTGGILRAGAANVFADGAVNIVGGRLDLANFDQRIGSLSGTGTVTLGTATLTVGDNNLSTSYDGVISGTGSIVKTGTGTLTLTGANTFSGTTQVNGGTLVANGTLANATVVVGAASRLGGNSTFSSLDISGTLAPGNSIGTTRTTGNVTFNPGSIYEVETNGAGGSDQLIVGGNVSILGGTVRVKPTGGSLDYDAQTNYQIITATGTITGTFAGVTSDLAFLTPNLSYTTQAVSLRLQRNDLAFASIAANANQAAAAAAIQASGTGTLFRTVLGQSATGAQTAFGQLSGEIYGTIPALAAYQARQSRDALLNRLADPVGRGAWMSVSSSSTDVDPAVGRTAFGRQATSIRGGVDARLLGFRLGATAANTTTKVDMGAIASSARLNGTEFGIYGSADQGPLKLRLGVTTENTRANVARSVNVSGFSDALASKYRLVTVQAFGEIAYAQKIGILTVQPFVDIGAVRVRDGVARMKGAHVVESGGAAALELAPVTGSTFEVRGGLRLDGGMPLSGLGTLHLTGTFAAQNQNLERVAQRTVTFHSNSQSFDIRGNYPSETSGSANVGVSLETSGGAVVSLRYAGEYARSYQENGVQLGLAWHF